MNYLKTVEKYSGDIGCRRLAVQAGRMCFPLFILLAVFSLNLVFGGENHASAASFPEYAGFLADNGEFQLNDVDGESPLSRRFLLLCKSLYQRLCLFRSSRVTSFDCSEPVLQAEYCFYTGSTGHEYFVYTPNYANLQLKNGLFVRDGPEINVVLIV